MLFDLIGTSLGERQGEKRGKREKEGGHNWNSNHVSHDSHEGWMEWWANGAHWTIVEWSVMPKASLRVHNGPHYVLVTPSLKVITHLPQKAQCTVRPARTEPQNRFFLLKNRTQGYSACACQASGIRWTLRHGFEIKVSLCSPVHKSCHYISTVRSPERLRADIPERLRAGIPGRFFIWELVQRGA